MKLTVLLDNNTLIGRYLLGEPGLSLFIEADGQKLLLDCGYSDAFIRNAQKLDINLLDLDAVVLSHAHLDHTWGLIPLIQLQTEARIRKLEVKVPDLVAHPAVFATRKSRRVPEIGSLMDADKLSNHFNLQLSREPVQITENLFFLGEIERANTFEAQRPLGTIVDGDSEAPDTLMDDTALVYKTHEGLVIITGCSHSGICNIVDAARKLCDEQRVVDIIGGFHLLKPAEEQLQGTINYLNSVNPDQLHACHCTDLQSKIALAQTLPVKEVGVGMVLEY